MPVRPRLTPADLTPARLAGVHLVRAYDPARPGFEAWVVVTEPTHPDDTHRFLSVAVDADRWAEQEGTIFWAIRAACTRA